tara:strand:+ start:1340 stop:1573 length:234 start_codon:yes stop_codon:yes gene_type:complete
MFLPKIMQKLNMILQKLTYYKMNIVLKVILGSLLIIFMQPIEMLMKVQNFILFSVRNKNMVPKNVAPKKKGCGCGKK